MYSPLKEPGSRKETPNNPAHVIQKNIIPFPSEAVNRVRPDRKKKAVHKREMWQTDS